MRGLPARLPARRGLQSNRMTPKRSLNLAALIVCLTTTIGLHAREIELLVPDDQPLPTSLPVFSLTTRPTLQSLQQSHPPDVRCGLCIMQRAASIGDAPRKDPPLIAPEESLFPDYVLSPR
jgi:hypothetical protein